MSLIVNIINVEKQNNILLKEISNIESNTTYNNDCKFVHFSIDDTIEIFRDITTNENKYKSIFENDILKFLKKCHDKYGAKFSMYVFYDYDDINEGIALNECTDKFKYEFEKNSDWLKFGFHAYYNSIDYSNIEKDEVKEQYEMVINELKRITGTNSIDTIIRMEKFIASKETIESLKKCSNGITGLLGADTDDRTNYYLSEEENNSLFEEDKYYDEKLDILIYKTDLRLEKIEEKDIKITWENIKNDNNLIIFTHEWILNKQFDKIEELCEYAIQDNYVFTFPMYI